MTQPIRIWTCAAYHPVYLCGGWASVRSSQGEITGVAGGERHTTAIRVALSGLAAALRDLPPIGATAASPIAIQTTSLELAAFTEILAALGTPSPAAAPDEDLDLWARIIAASKGRRLDLVLTPSDAGAPTAFAAAWAELARDKAKATGPFVTVIPKPNLARIKGLARL